jgi:hypothetical protein
MCPCTSADASEVRSSTASDVFALEELAQRVAASVEGLVPGDLTPDDAAELFRVTLAVEDAIEEIRANLARAGRLGGRAG